MEIEQKFLESTEYFQQKVIKKNLVLHHTASAGNPYNVIAWWNQQKPDRVATNFVMGGYGEYDGKLLQCMPEDNWAWNLGIGNSRIEEKTISLEMCSWGNLQEVNGKYFNYVGGEVPENQVVDLVNSDYGKKWRGYQYFHKYSDKQIECLEEFLYYIVEKHPIDLSLFKEGFDWWWFELNSNALSGVDGIWNHSNYLIGKTDLYPDKRVLDILNRLLIFKNQ